MFWHVTPCHLVSVSRRFEERYCLRLHGFRPSRRLKNDSSDCEDEGTTVLLKRREAPVQRNSVTCNFSFVLLWVTCAETTVYRPKVAVRYNTLLRLCRTSRYRHLVCRGAAAAAGGVTTVDWTESDCSMVLSEYCELVQLRLVTNVIQLSAALLA